MKTRILILGSLLSSIALAQQSNIPPSTQPAAMPPNNTTISNPPVTNGIAPINTTKPMNNVNGTPSVAPNNTMPPRTTTVPTTMPQNGTTQMNTSVSISDQNKQAGATFLNSNRSLPGVTTLPSGLQYKILQAGTGEKPTKNDVVTVDYEGRHLNGQVFDSSYQRGQSATFPLTGVILGWQEALQMMPVGSTWELYIPANLAYGEHGVPGAIAPNETLIFKVHLISAKKPA